MTACQSSTHPQGGPPAAFELTFQSAPIQSKGATLPGLTWHELACRVCASPRQDAVRADGGALVEAEVLPPPPPIPSIAPIPVGLDAIDPPIAAPEPPTEGRGGVLGRLARLRERLASRARGQGEPVSVSVKGRYQRPSMEG